MPRTPEENARIRQASRENIMSSALEVFIERGYHHATIDDIARKAGVSKGSLYNYYKGKEDVLAEIVKGRIEELVQVMEAAVAQTAPHEQLRSIIDGAVENVQQRPKAYRFFLHLQTQPEEDQILAQYSYLLNLESVKQFEVQCEMFTRLGASNPRVRSLYFSSSLQGVMLMMSTYPDRYPVQEVTEQLITEFCTV